MESRRRITEEDLLVTEACIADSYGRLKKSVVQAPSRALGSVGGTIRRHPFATTATAVVAGVVVYGIFKLITSRASVQETQGSSRVSMQKDMSRPDLMHDMLSMMIPLAAPYITGYIQKYIGEILSGELD
jgi:predicted ribonuclease toxin of YeeF-YezG toxin-antitoxin module